MKLEFDSVSELQQFLQFAYDLGERLNTGTPKRPDGASGSAGDGGPLPTIDIAFDTPPRAGCKGENCGTTTGDHSPECIAEHERACNSGGASGDTKPASAPEPAKRKRRTKAEIEADEKAARDAQTLPTPDMSGPEHVAPAAEGEQVPTGTNPFEQAAAAGGEPASEAESDAAAEDAAETVVTPFQHLTRAREFIAKHGIPKYNESFTKAGLDANVMGYSAVQRALHMTALDELDKG